MASSIHAIYRPVARSRRRETSQTILARQMFSAQSEVDEAPHADVNRISDDDVDGDDFEAATPRPLDSQGYSDRKHMPSPTAQLGPAIRRRPSRADSIATVKITRRTRLAEKLKEIFDLEAINEVLCGMWFC